MTSLHDAIGKPTILRDTAEKIGDVRSFAADAGQHRVTALVVGVGRKSLIVDWDQIQSIGPDAVIVDATREPTADDERAVSGASNPLDKRVLSDLGNALGTTLDADADDDGTIQQLHVGDEQGDEQVDGGRLRGVGSYAVVVAADPAEA